MELNQYHGETTTPVQVATRPPRPNLGVSSIRGARPKSAHIPCTNPWGAESENPYKETTTTVLSLEQQPVLRREDSRTSVKKPARPVSAEIRRENRVAPSVGGAKEFVDDHDGRGSHQLTLLMYVVGGREVGQVTVFRRPISVWRLDLTKTF